MPIYWGNPDIEKDFNGAAFINCHRFDNFDQVVEKVIELDNNDALWTQYANAPIFAVPDWANTEKALDCLEHFLKFPPKTPAALSIYNKMMRYKIFQIILVKIPKKLMLYYKQLKLYFKNKNLIT